MMLDPVKYFNLQVLHHNKSAALANNYLPNEITNPNLNPIPL
jgi:hypothetical protein